VIAVSFIVASLANDPHPPRVVVFIEHTDKDEPKLLHHGTPPLTGAHVIDMVITNLGVFQIGKQGGGMTLLELAPEVSLQEIRGETETDYALGSGVG
jgi:3-oxoacid CoA-transferase subunit B